MNDVCLTLDVDWAPEAVLDEVLAQVIAAGARATVFATHPSEALLAQDPDQIEVALHPAFTAEDDDSPLETLRQTYPHAIGARSHRLFVSSRVLEHYERHGIRYESNMLLPLHPGLAPVARRPRLLSIPFYWADDLPTAAEVPGIGDLRLDAPGLKVLDFHPIHVFMNTMSVEHYEAFRPHYSDTAALRDFVNAERRGVGVALPRGARPPAACHDARDPRPPRRWLIRATRDCSRGLSRSSTSTCADWTSTPRRPAARTC